MRSVADQLYGYSLSRAYPLAPNENLPLCVFKPLYLVKLLDGIEKILVISKNYYYVVTANLMINNISYKGNYITIDTDDKGRLINEERVKNIIYQTEYKKCLIKKAEIKMKEQPPIIHVKNFMIYYMIKPNILICQPYCINKQKI